MTAVFLILAAFPALLLITVAFFVILVIGIRKADRVGLRTPANGRLDALTRRVVGGARRNGPEADE